MPQTSLSLEPLRCLVAQIWTMHLFFSLIFATILCIKKKSKGRIFFFWGRQGRRCQWTSNWSKAGLFQFYRSIQQPERICFLQGRKIKLYAAIVKEAKGKKIFSFFNGRWLVLYNDLKVEINTTLFALFLGFLFKTFPSAISVGPQACRLSANHSPLIKQWP